MIWSCCCWQPWQLLAKKLPTTSFFDFVYQLALETLVASFLFIKTLTAALIRVPLSLLVFMWTMWTMVKTI